MNEIYTRYHKFGSKALLYDYTDTGVIVKEYEEVIGTPVEQFELNVYDIILVEGNTFQITVKSKPFLAQERVIYEPLDDNIKVSDKGLITAISEGESAVLVTIDNITKTVYVTVRSKFVQGIYDAMIGWYSPKKQQLTNTSIKANPVLKDFSGKGNDLTMHNFKGTATSGIKYQQQFSNETYKKDGILGYTYNPSELVSITAEKIIATGDVLQVAYASDGIDTYYHPSYKIKISGIEGNNKLIFKYNTTEARRNYLYLTNGITTLPGFSLKLTDGEQKVVLFGFDIHNCVIKQINQKITLEMVPENDNALYYDGNSCCYNDNMPILQDYTLIAEREWNDDGTYRFFASYGKVGDVQNNSGATSLFWVEGIRYPHNGHPNVDVRVTSVGGVNLIKLTDIPAKIFYQVKAKYNGTLSLVYSTLSYTGPSEFNLGCFYKNNNTFKGNHKDVLLFNRSLTTEEIEYVKTNLMGYVEQSETK